MAAAFADEECELIPLFKANGGAGPTRNHCGGLWLGLGQCTWSFHGGGTAHPCAQPAGTVAL